MAQAAVQLSSTDQLLAAAMELPEPERAELVRALLASLSPVTQEGMSADAAPEPDPELTAELQRRRRAYLAGEIDSISLEELDRDLAGVLATVQR
jgi:putative addiction module component (TIGR02574 family)